MPTDPWPNAPCDQCLPVSILVPRNAPVLTIQFHLPDKSGYRSATWKAAENDCLERRNSIRPCVPSHVAYKAERGGNELFWSPWKNVSTLARAAPKP
jgi:hypothetical protein